MVRLSKHSPLPRAFLSLSVFLTILILSILSACAKPTRRDAFTSVRGNAGDTRLTSLGSRPAGAYARSLNVTSTSSIFTWYSKTPRNESDAESAFIIIHGVKRNAGTYWTILNNAWAKARDASFGSARPNSIRVAPLFFSTNEDAGVYNSSQLGWADSNAWTVGEASTNPPDSSVSSFSVLDMLLNRFSNTNAYPNMKYITFVAHGGGAQMLQRYAVLGGSNSVSSQISLRFVIGDPSSALYFTRDRPVGVDQSSCPLWNDYRYGINNYTSNYGLLNSLGAPTLFKAYANKQVRYVVGLNDTQIQNGDQTCMAHAVGGQLRRNRSLAYWKYIHLLAGQGGKGLENFPGSFPSLNPQQSGNKTNFQNNNTSNIPRSSYSVANKFKGVEIKHTLTVVQGAGHSASKVYSSTVGRYALFADQANSGGGTVPDFSNELIGYTADAAGAKSYDDGDDGDDD
ncbi:uncharacterized protein MEPE_04296 [Melanopsichium pennsylvanicum]|uniref:Transmembrane protein n=1 Tax=Melanopsichium pennsylvanicum TaxID=63383 RepID=A0AAJ4XPM9_9BASI|nr:uncharacterized protein MEPE_04296 [Melanopsichium pennsylvanicum]